MSESKKGTTHYQMDDTLLATAQELANRRVSPPALEAYCIEAMRRAGWRDEDAQTTARVLVTTDTMGVYTHGSKQLRTLLKYHRSGRMDATATPEVVSEGPSWALIDGKEGVPMTVATMGMNLAIEKARTTGMAYVGAKRSSHFGAAGYYANLAAEQGMIGLAMCNVDPCQTVPGARGTVLGTNPIAYAVPAGEERTVLLDIATSAVAASKVFAARALGKPVPENWLVDDLGRPTTDPSEYPEKGALLPMAGHKGYGIALLVEILTGALTGAGMAGQVGSWVQDQPNPTGQGFAFLAIDVGVTMPASLFRERMDWLIRSIKEAPKAEGSERIYLPGEMEWERRDQALAEGMLLPADVIASLSGLAQDMGLDLGMLFD